MPARFKLIFCRLLYFRFFYFLDFQFPIDVNGVQKDHPFLDLDSLQSLFRRLQALNRCANMKLDFVPKHVAVSYYTTLIYIYIICFHKFENVNVVQIQNDTTRLI